MREIHAKSRAKINLTLEITARRPDNYHEIETIMQTVHLHDNLHIKKIKKQEITLQSNMTFLPTDERNLAFQGAKLIQQNYSLSHGISIFLHKKIPVSAGLGGGSSNGATTLMSLNKLFNLQIPLGTLQEMGASLGADIPYLLTGGTVLATGFGEQLTPLPDFPFAFVLIIRPPAIISTKKIFNALDISMISAKTSTQSYITKYQKGLSSIPRSPKNTLESITGAKYPIIKALQIDLLERGAISAQMSGSGPSVFGLFANKNKCYLAMNQLRKKHPQVKGWYMTGIDNKKSIPMQQRPFPTL